ncbi:MAG: DUF6629 family protein [Pseudomonadota bacterium]
MCFSAPVSFAAAAVLLPLGLHALRQAWRTDRRYLLLAAFPLLFGVQQFSEGWVWLSLGGFHPEYARASALGFLFFVYLVWPVITPLAARALEDRPRQRAMLLYVALFAGLMGALVYLPLLPVEARVQASIVQHSILYQHRPLFEEQWNDWVARIGYALVIVLPLIVASTPNLRIFGGLIALSLILSALYFDYAFTSVWCFFAAILSGFILRMIRMDARRPPFGLTSAKPTLAATSPP